MEIKLITNPTDQFVKSVMDSQAKFFDYNAKDIFDLTEIYYSIPEAYVVAYEDTQIIGCVNLLKRQITFDNVSILLGGIGGVCVDKEFRHKGIAKEMLTLGMEHLKKWKCDVAYLCTDVEIKGKLYEHIGFVALNRKRKSIGKSGKEYIDGGVMIAPVSTKDKFELILKSNSILDLQGGDW